MSAELRAALEAIIRAALRAADPAEAIRRHVRREGESLFVDDAAYDLRAFDDLRLIAAGKASAPMAGEVGQLLGNRLSRAVVVTKHGHLSPDLNSKLKTQNSAIIEAGHPIPDEDSLRAGEAVCTALRDCTARTLVIVCVSGGASALLVAPHAGISLSTLRAINDALLRSGADIHEMNAVRARLDRLKGGGLVRLAQPATVIGLILSDVIGDPLDVIASGLTNDPRAHNVLVGNNAQACQAAAHEAERLGFAACVVTTTLRGEAREAGAQIARALLDADPPAQARGVCWIYGGETTVTLRPAPGGEGKGGRNQELALAAAIELDAHQTPGGSETLGVSIAALGTDGTDGPTDAAGAIAFTDTLRRARARGLEAGDYLERHDSYHFFAPLGDLIMTGPTGTNVADVIITLRPSDAAHKA
ncbi:MAG: hydroxypyruvate reductase [Candidatus Roseilinea sp.]|nr:MAG: hydroxypyruvate reductase [Candidatus Roseilinea sp.]